MTTGLVHRFIIEFFLCGAIFPVVLVMEVV